MSEVPDTLHDQARHLMVAGLTPYTAIDYPGRFSAVVFVQGCPWKCLYCHNPHMQPRRFDERFVHGNWDQVVALLKRRQGLLDAVVFSGGEPTIDPALSEAIDEVKAMGFLVGLHTSGCYPEHLKTIIHKLDWVGLDVKAPLSDGVLYQKIVGRDKGDHAAAVSRCLDLLIEEKVQFECRTTAHPAYLSDESLLKLARELSARGVNHYALQVYRCPKELELPFENVGYEYPSKAILAILDELFENFELRRG